MRGKGISKLLYFLFVFCFAVSFAFADSITSDSCPQGATYNPSTNTCDAVPGCTYGQYNAQTGKCEMQPVCLQGHLHGNQCVQPLDCPKGTFEQNGQCAIHAQATCPQGYTLQNNECVMTVPPTCPSGYANTDNGQCQQQNAGFSGSIQNWQGQTLVHGFENCIIADSFWSGKICYNPQTNVFRGTINYNGGFFTSMYSGSGTNTIVGDGGYFGISGAITYDPSSNTFSGSIQGGGATLSGNDNCLVFTGRGVGAFNKICFSNGNTGGIASATCPSGYTLQNNQCVKQVTPMYTCPQHTTPSPNASICYINGTSCPPNMPFNQQFNACVTSPVCPQGTVYNLQTNTCNSNPVCPSGYTFTNNTCQGALDLNSGLDQYYCNGESPCYICTSTNFNDTNNTQVCQPGKQQGASAISWLCPIQKTQCSKGCQYGQLSSQTGDCLAPKNLCPPGSVFNATLNLCVTPSSCIFGTLVGDTCEGTPLCPSGMNFEVVGGYGKCVGPVGDGVVLLCTHYYKVPSSETWVYAHEPDKNGNCPPGYMYSPYWNICVQGQWTGDPSDSDFPWTHLFGSNYYPTQTITVDCSNGGCNCSDNNNCSGSSGYGSTSSYGGYGSSSSCTETYTCYDSNGNVISSDCTPNYSSSSSGSWYNSYSSPTSYTCTNWFVPITHGWSYGNNCHGCDICYDPITNTEGGGCGLPGYTQMYHYRYICGTTYYPCERSYSCPSGQTYDPNLNACTTNFSCPSGTMYNSSTATCNSPPVCPPGFIYIGNGQCGSSAMCPPGYYYNDTIQMCEGTPTYVCPYGNSNVCIQEGDNYYCSPYNCSGVSEGTVQYPPGVTPGGAPPGEGNSGSVSNGVRYTKPVESSSCTLKDVRIFAGSDKRCRPPGFDDLFQNCCVKGRHNILGLLTYNCNGEEQKLAALRSWGDLNGADGQCHYVGEYCSHRIKTPLFKICLQHKKTYCCFASGLSRIIQEAAHQQLDISWGSPKSPNCAGLTIAQFQKIDFSKIDFSEWIQYEVDKNVKPKVSSSISSATQNMINNLYNSQ